MSQTHTFFISLCKNIFQKGTRQTRVIFSHFSYSWLTKLTGRKSAFALKLKHRHNTRTEAWGELFLRNCNIKWMEFLTGVCGSGDWDSQEKTEGARLLAHTTDHSRKPQQPNTQHSDLDDHFNRFILNRAYTYVVLYSLTSSVINNLLMVVY